MIESNGVASRSGRRTNTCLFRSFLPFVPSTWMNRHGYFEHCHSWKYVLFGPSANNTARKRSEFFSRTSACSFTGSALPLPDPGIPGLHVVALPSTPARLAFAFFKFFSHFLEFAHFKISLSLGNNFSLLLPLRAKVKALTAQISIQSGLMPSFRITCSIRTRSKPNPPISSMLR